MYAQCCFNGNLNDPILEHEWLAANVIKIYCPECQNEWIIERKMSAFQVPQSWIREAVEEYRSDENDE